MSASSGGVPARTAQFPCPGPAEVEVHLGSGSLLVELTDDATTVEVSVAARPGSWWSQGLSGVLAALGAPAEGAPGEDPDQARRHAQQATLVEFEPGRRRVVVRGARTGPARAAALDVRVLAPTRSRVRVRTTSATVQVVGTADAVEVSAGSGEVTVQDVLGTVEVRSGSGSVRTGALGAGGQIRTGSGHVTVDAATGDLDVLTGSGSLRVGIAPGALAELDLRSGSGRARSELPVLAEVDDPAARTVRVHARTGSGGVLVHAARA